MSRAKRRKRHDIDTERMRLIKSSALLLRDLKKFELPPAGVAVPRSAIPLRIAPETSGCRSPAQACAELGWRWRTVNQ